MNVEISVFVICIEAIIYLFLYKLHDFTFKQQDDFRMSGKYLVNDLSGSQGSAGKNYVLNTSSRCLLQDLI